MSWGAPLLAAMAEAFKPVEGWDKWWPKAVLILGVGITYYILGWLAARQYQRGDKDQ